MTYTSTVPFRHTLLAAAAFSMSALSTPQAIAQTYPTRTMQMVVPFAAGGGVDVATRLVTEKMGAVLGQRFVIENRGGGGTIVGTQGVARAAGDGYTLLAAPTTLVINPALREKLPYDWEKDFVPVVMLAKLPFVVVAASAFPANTMMELEGLGRSGSEPLTFGSGGTGTVAHLAGELFGIQSGAKMQHVPYRGEAPALTDAIGGRLSVMFSTLASASGQIEGKTLKPLAVTTRQRTTLLPDIPTVAEQGYADYDISAWVALVAPKGTPDEVVATLNRAANTALSDDNLRTQLAKVGAEPGGGTPEELASFMKKNAEIWAWVVKAANVKPE
jgi:tripartite-type tricarboxylate transporter receptor subunit TctC